MQRATRVRRPWPAGRGAAAADRHPHGRAGARRRGLRRDGRGGGGADLRRRPRRSGRGLTANTRHGRRCARSRWVVSTARTASPEGRPGHRPPVPAPSRPDLRDEFPPLRTLSATSLPALHHRLVGRADALARIESLLDEPAVRLVTITGPGGAGKSRLALEVAAAAALDRPVHLVGLAPVTDPDLVPNAIARAIGVRESGERPLLPYDCRLAERDGRAPLPRQLRAPGAPRGARGRTPRRCTGSRHSRHEPCAASPLDRARPPAPAALHRRRDDVVRGARRRPGGDSA